VSVAEAQSKAVRNFPVKGGIVLHHRPRLCP